MSKLEIVNTALAELALPLLVSTNFDQDPNAKRLDLIYQSNLNYLLECYNWRFALTTTVLDSPIVEPQESVHKVYEFQLPTDIARIYKVEYESFDITQTPFYGTFLSRLNNDTLPDLSYLANYDTRENIIYSPAAKLTLTYVKRNPIPEKFAGIFTKILIMKIKQSLIFSSTQQGFRAEQAIEFQIERLLKKAIRTGAVQKKIPNPQPDFWFNSRFYGSVTF